VYLDIRHDMRWHYDQRVSESYLELRLQPKTTAHQTVSSFVLAVGPPTKVYRYRDWNENAVHHATIAKFHDSIQVQSRSLVHTHPSLPPLGAISESAPAPQLSYELYDHLLLKPPLAATPRLAVFHRSLTIPRNAALGRQIALLGAALKERFDYRKNVTRYDSTTDDFLKAEAGVCQDFTHLMLALCRLRRIPSRYVSGYLHVDRKRAEPSQSHAWIEFYSVAHGWVPFDPTHNREIDERYVVVAHGRHYDDVTPNKGVYRGSARETLEVEVHTETSERKPISTFYEEIRQIDVPVFQEIADHRIHRLPTVQEEAAAQQQ